MKIKDKAINLNRFLYFLMVAVLLLSGINQASPSSSAEIPTVSEILNRTVEAKTKVDYVGKRIVIIWQPYGSMGLEERVIHKSPSTRFIEVILPKGPKKPDSRKDRPPDDSEGARLSDRKERNRRRRYPPPPHEIHKLQDIWRENTQLLLQNYSIDVEIGEPIAGQKTYLLTINPKVDSRPRNKIWLDAQNYVILRVEHYDIDGEIHSLSVYTTIDYRSKLVEQELRKYQKKEDEKNGSPPPPRYSEKVTLSEAEEKLGAPILQPSYLPAGFELQKIALVTFHENFSIHLRYSDGLSDFSLFMSKIDKEPDERPRRPPRDRREFKTVNVEGVSISIMDRDNFRILHWQTENQNDKKMQFVLIGELGEEELLKLASSLIYQFVSR